MPDTAVLRLLHQGLPDGGTQPFPLEELFASPLRPLAPDEWETYSRDGLELLERRLPELSAPLYLAGQATSSLDAAHALIRRGLLPEWGSVLVNSQTAGRGQMRRAWLSPPGNIYAALRLPLDPPLDSSAAAPAVGALIAEALTRMGYHVLLKWPNDILQVKHENSPRDHSKNIKQNPNNGVEYQKISGILLEERAGALVAGIGINTAHAPAPSALRENHAFAAGILTLSPAQEKTAPEHVRDTGKSLSSWWARLAGGLVSCYLERAPKSCGKWWLPLAEKHLAFRGCRVCLSDEASNSRHEGVLDGLDESGALRLRIGSGIQSFSGGSLSPCGRPFARGDYGR